MNVAIKTYDDPKVWLGYIDADPFTLFFPADGGDPVLHNRKAIAQDENGHSCATCNPVDLPKLLRDLREAAGISQAQMASSLGFKSPATISLYESGKRRITVGELEAMSNALGYSVELHLAEKDSQGKPIFTDPVNPYLPCQGKPIFTDPVNPYLPDPTVIPHSFNPNGNHSVPNGTVSAPPPPKSANGKSKPQDALGEDALNKSSVAAPVAVEAEMLKAWGKLFPNKRQPRPGTHLSEIRTLLKKTPDFGDVWLAAMSAAAESKACQAEGWFQFAFFVKPTKGNKPDLNYRRCLDRFMAWKDKDYKGKTEPIRFETAEDTAAEFARMNAHLPPLGADL